MFSRKACYFFVRPKKSFLEVCIFLGRPIKSPKIRRADRVSKSKVAHMIRVTHRDEVEAPLTDWLREAYESSDILKTPSRPPAAKKAAKKPARKAQKKTAPATRKNVRPRSRRTSKS
jgi:hypothetical protein